MYANKNTTAITNSLKVFMTSVMTTTTTMMIKYNDDDGGGDIYPAYG